MEYIDRLAETEIINNIYSTLNESSLLIMFSKTGTGKSSLSHKFTDSLKPDTNTDVIYVITNQINSDFSSQGFYQMEVFKWVYKYFKNDDEFSFENFIFKNKRYKKYIISKILSESQSQDSLKSLVLKVFGVNILKRIFKIDEFDYETLFEDYSKQTSRITKEYIEFILENRKLVLVVDNIQNIDDLSLDMLLDWLSVYRENKHFFIFEYTIDDTRENIIKMRERINNYNLKLHFFELNNMDFENAITAASIRAQDNDRINVAIEKNVAKKYYERVDGNIRSLEDFIRGYSHMKSFDSSNSATFEAINSLNNSEALILSIVCLNNSRINKYLLGELLNNGEKNININYSLNVLINELDLLVERDDDYYVKHASIVDNWNKASEKHLKKTALIAYSLLKNHYNKLFDNSLKNNNLNTYLLLIELYLKYEPDKLYYLLNNFNTIMRDFLSPYQLEEYIVALDKELEGRELEYTDFYYKLINICLDVKLFDLADKLLQKLFDHNNIKKYIFYKCNIFIQKEDHASNIEFINRILDDISDEYFILYLKLFLMVSYRSVNDMSMVRAINEEIKRYIDKYNNTLFFGFYLRLSEIRKSRNDAIYDVEESIKHFKKFNTKIQIAKSQVALSFLYAVTGRISDAIIESDKAEKIIVKNFSNRQIFFNNKAAIYLLNGNTGGEILSMLKTAEEFAIGTFDKLAIFNNILVYSIETKDSRNAKIYASKILSIIRNEKDKHLLSILYFNLHLYYETIDDYVHSDEYLTKSYSLKEYCKSLNARLTGITIDDGTQILISKPWHVCFLDYWDVDYCEDFN